MPTRLFFVVLLGFCYLQGVVYCLENVALGRPAFQSGSFHAYTTADKAVDGNHDANIYHGSCSHPDSVGTYGGAIQPNEADREQPAWWRVDLGEEHDVYQVVIYNRQDCCQYFLDSSLVLVSNELNPDINNPLNLCGVIETGQNLMTIDCNYDNIPAPRRGRYVMIKRQEGAQHNYYMNICEVEVMSCTTGMSGINLPDGAADCSRGCNCHSDGPCRVSDGFCYNQCARGFWGLDCTLPCGHCAGDCSQESACGPAGCAPGYGGSPACTIELPRFNTDIDISNVEWGRVTLYFNKWAPSHGGVGPVVAYRIEKQERNSTNWVLAYRAWDISECNGVQAKVTGLQPNTFYRFRIVPIVNDGETYFDGVPTFPTQFIRTAESGAEEGSCDGVTCNCACSCP